MRITIDELKTLLRQRAVVQVVDVRTRTEFASSHIPGALNMPLEEVEARLGDLEQGGPVVLVCQSGTRAGIACNLLSDHHPELIVLEGGTKAWIDAGLPSVSSTRTRWSLERQVRLAAGLLVVTGVLMSIYVASSWIFLSLLVGLGLTFAGLTDICGMGLLFAQMPWNRRRRLTPSGTSTEAL